MNPQNSVRVTSAKTLVDGDHGIRQDVAVDGGVITLPAAAPGKSFLIRAAGVAKANAPTGTGDNKSMSFTVRPAGTDTLTGLAFTPGAAKGAVLTKATMMVGDFIRVDAGAGTWYVTSSQGTFTREA